MERFYKLLGNTLIAMVTNFFAWFSLTYWAYLETGSVITTSIIAGIFAITTAISSFWFGSIVDHNRKKHAMIMSSAFTLFFYTLALIMLIMSPEDAYKSVSSPWLWILVVVILSGAIAGNIRNIALPTAIGILVPEEKRDRANGMFGTIMGISFALSNVASGLVLGFAGMIWVVTAAVVITALCIIHLFFIAIPEDQIVHVQGQTDVGKIDVRGTIAVIRTIPGLFGLIFFTTFNNFLGGVFMSLMDAYGLSLVSVQVWGTIWGFLSLSFIVGGLYISKYGLGASPLRTLFKINIALWIISIIFPIQPSIILLTACMAIYLVLVPFVEAVENTIIQKVVPQERLGRVIGFAQSIEQAASPLTSFMIGPIAQYIFIPFMTVGAGVELIGDWFGVGTGRGLALVFILAGIIGLIVTLIARRSKSYKLLSKKYQE